MKLANITIGKKLGLLVGLSVLQLVSLAAVAWWAVQTLSQGLEATRKEGHREALALNVSEHLNAIGVSVANGILANQFDDNRTARILSLRKEYWGYLDELSALAVTAEGKRELQALEAAAQQWREGVDSVLQVEKAGRLAEANALYHRRLVPQIDVVRAVLGDYLKYREQRLQAVDEEMAASASHTKTLLLVFGAVWLAALLTLSRVISRGITVPLSQAVLFLEDVAKGDLTHDVRPEHLERQDEIGGLAQAVQRMTESMRDVMKNMTEGIGVLSSSSAELSANSGQTSASGQKAAEKAHSVAAAAEEVTANVTSVAAGMEQTTANLTSVATATEQMTATIGEIANNSEKARRITEEATRQAARISEQMNQLGEAAQQIGKVTETITEISSQTNLLALNATIEAARAGSAGKGFAVVANEIKELAQQTATATEDIKARIAGVQSSTGGGIAEIEKVSHVIHEVSEIVASIAAAIEEQATVTKDIARNIGEASTGVKDANVRVAESSQATESIAREIAVVDQSTREMAEASDQVRHSATDLSKLAEQLQTIVYRFHFTGGNQAVLKNAIKAHQAWTTRLQSAIKNRQLDTPVTTVRADDQCQFGKWLYGKEISAEEMRSERYQTVKRLHAQFHQEAARVAQMAISGQQEAAEQAMSSSSEYARISAALVAELNRWSTAS